MDFDIVSGMRDKQSPAWDGEWQGLNVLQLLSNDFSYVERCIAFVRNTNTGLNEIWEILDNEFYDSTAAPVNTVVEAKTLDCGKPKNIKKLRRGDLYFTHVMAATAVKVDYRSDGYPNWVPWHELNIDAQSGGNLCALDPCVIPGSCPAAAAPGTLGGGYWYIETTCL